jgi:hypothetical protein
MRSHVSIISLKANIVNSSAILIPAERLCPTLPAGYVHL